MSEKGDGGIRGEMKSSGGKTKGYGEDGGWCGGWGVRVMWKKVCCILIVVGGLGVGGGALGALCVWAGGGGGWG